MGRWAGGEDRRAGRLRLQARCWVLGAWTHGSVAFMLAGVRIGFRSMALGTGSGVWYWVGWGRRRVGSQHQHQHHQKGMEHLRRHDLVSSSFERRWGERIDRGGGRTRSACIPHHPIAARTVQGLQGGQGQTGPLAHPLDWLGVCKAAAASHRAKGLPALPVRSRHLVSGPLVPVQLRRPCGLVHAHAHHPAVTRRPSASRAPTTDPNRGMSTRGIPVRRTTGVMASLRLQ